MSAASIIPGSWNSIHRLLTAIAGTHGDMQKANAIIDLETADLLSARQLSEQIALVYNHLDALHASGHVMHEPVSMIQLEMDLTSVKLHAADK